MSHNILNNSLKTTLSYVLFRMRKFKRRSPFENVDSNVKKHVINLNKYGYSTILNYISDSECEMLRKQYDLAIVGHPNAVWQDDQGFDKRIFGIEYFGKAFKNFHDDSFLKKIGSCYFKGRLENLLTLGGKIEFLPGNSGSGGGWHRDGSHFQFKAILYLTDVNEYNGPFQILEGSHKLIQVICDDKVMGVKPLEDRFTQSQVDELIKRSPRRLKTFKAKQGTLILVDTSAIHRGCPIAEGNRYALTNYYYPSFEMSYRKNQFKTFLNYWL
jgi:hypothetical protein